MTGRSAALVVALGLLGACTPIPLWKAPAEVRAPDRDVAAVLGDAYRGAAPPFNRDAIPLPPEPTQLRPCCVLGADLRVAVGVVPVPGFTLDNVRGPADLGPHKYNVGLFAISSSDERGVIEHENNAEIYTCRGGFIDTAHVRDWADTTVYLTAQAARNMDTGAAIDLSEQGGKRRVVLKAIDKDRIANVGRRPLASAIGQWLAFQLSIWHEIATWYGYSSVEGWSERISAFSPEDFYSNLLGIKLAGGIGALRDSSDERQYNESMDAWIAMALQRLQALPKEAGLEAMRSVQGIWWDADRRVPDWELLKRRRFDTGALIKPWVVSMAFAPGASPFKGCVGRGPWLALRNPDSFEGVPFSEDAGIEIDVSDAMAKAGFPFPRKDSHVITQADFPAILAQVRRENAAVFGPRADQPAK